MRIKRYKKRPIVVYLAVLGFIVSLGLIVYSVTGIIIGNLEIKNTLSKWDIEMKKDGEVINEDNTLPHSDESGKSSDIVGTSKVTDKIIKNEAQQIKIEGDIIGAVSFPKLGERAGILEGTDNEQLKRGAGHYRGTAFPGNEGNCVLTGHNDTVFKDIDSLKTGDEIVIDTLSGKFSYKVTDTKIADESDISCLSQDTGEILTLITCYPLYYIGQTTERYIVTAEMEGAGQ